MNIYIYVYLKRSLLYSVRLIWHVAGHCFPAGHLSDILTLLFEIPFLLFPPALYELSPFFICFPVYVWCPQMFVCTSECVWFLYVCICIHVYVQAWSWCCWESSYLFSHLIHWGKMSQPKSAHWCEGPGLTMQLSLGSCISFFCSWNLQEGHQAYLASHDVWGHSAGPYACRAKDFTSEPSPFVLFLDSVWFSPLPSCFFLFFSCQLCLFIVYWLPVPSTMRHTASVGIWTPFCDYFEEVIAWSLCSAETLQKLCSRNMPVLLCHLEEYQVSLNHSIESY